MSSHPPKSNHSAIKPSFPNLGPTIDAASQPRSHSAAVDLVSDSLTIDKMRLGGSEELEFEMVIKIRGAEYAYQTNNLDPLTPIEYLKLILEEHTC